MPDDPTPHGGEVFHPPPDRAKIPQPKPSGREAALERTSDSESKSTHHTKSNKREPDVAHRPTLPDAPSRTPGDSRHRQPVPTAVNRDADPGDEGG